MTTPVVLIEEIVIRGRQRLARVHDPATGRRHTHGLGRIGEPIRPYEGERAEGYIIALPEDIGEIFLRRVDLTAEPNGGRLPLYPVPWSELGAPDVETDTSGGAA